MRPLNRFLGCPCDIAEGGSLRKLIECCMEGIFLTCMNNLFINVSGSSIFSQYFLLRSAKASNISKIKLVYWLMQTG